ncbi:hypothetical protein L6452_01701 [Arctium lappa]|uniref:Uncharacterized protein n=1 Tax=Arctium lappa TaxID=4217 RepID=A0ACB9FH22_ARCLA|nr:hypothetical protein L6452_01701 [Arctium lappa]
MAAQQGAPTLPWSRLPHIGHRLPSPIPQPHQAPPLPPPNQVLFTPRFRATTVRPPPPTANPPPPTANPPPNVVAPPSSPPSAPQLLVAKATAAPASSPILPMDPQYGAPATSPIITRAPTQISSASPLETVKGSPEKTSSPLTCCFM